MVRALYQVSTALECRVELVKITRCSTYQAVMADALSKGEWIKFMEESTKTGVEMNAMSHVLYLP